MGLLNNLIVRIRGDKTQLDSTLKGAEKSVSSFGTVIKRLGGVIAAAFSVTVIVGFAKKLATLYDAQAKAETALLIALKGREDIQLSIIKQASELQKITLFGDEQTIEAGARLAMILGKNENAIKRLLPLVQDLAQAKFQGNLVTAADMVAKSIGSSTNALSRYGIEINGAVGSAERLESALIGLNRQVGGQAKAAAETGIGAWTKLNNVWGDLKESLGQYIAESRVLNDVINGAIILIDKLNGKVAKERSKFIGMDEDELKRQKTIYEQTFDSLTNKAAKIQQEISGAGLFYRLGGGVKELNKELIKTEAEMGPVIDAMHEIDRLLNKPVNLDNTVGSIVGGGAGIKKEKGPGRPATGQLSMPNLKNISAGLQIDEIKINEITEALQWQQEVVYSLTDAFSNMFANVGEGFDGMIDSLIKSLERYVREILARAAVLALMNIIAPGSEMAVQAHKSLGGLIPLGGGKGLFGNRSVSSTSGPMEFKIYGKDLQTVLQRNQ